MLFGVVKDQSQNSNKRIQNQQELPQGQFQQYNSQQIFKYYKKQKYNKETNKFDFHFQKIKDSPINSTNFQKVQYFGKFFITKMFKNLQLQKNTLNTKKPNFYCKTNQIKATWMGHATVFLTIKNRINLIFDPVFQNSLYFMGPTRMVKAPCQIKDLPPLDYIFISHDHCDHFNPTSIDKIYKKQKKNVQFIIGKNSKDILPKQSKFTELSWTQSKILEKNGIKIKVTFVPACHWSQRNLNDMNQRLWGGYVIEVNCKTKENEVITKKIYFAGDTGYEQEYFKQLYKRFNGFDLCFLPIGAYQPNDQLRAQHTNPQQAVKIHNITKSKLSVGIHWGTFPLSHQSTQQVLADVQCAISSDENKKQLRQTFKTLDIGGHVVLKFQ